MKRGPNLATTQPVESFIRLVPGQRVILDADLARIYGVTTARLNQQVNRNVERFPADFCFRLKSAEFASLMLQSATSNKGRGGRRKIPNAFTEHGAIMAANVLNSREAIAMGVYVVRAFLRLRRQLAESATILRRLAEIDRTLIEHDEALKILWGRLQPLLAPSPDPPRRRVGFHVRGDDG